MVFLPRKSGTFLTSFTCPAIMMIIGLVRMSARGRLTADSQGERRPRKLAVGLTGQADSEQIPHFKRIATYWLLVISY